MCGHFAYRSKQRGPYRGCGEEAYRRWMEYNRKKTICGENRNSYSKTDTDATFMHKSSVSTFFTNISLYNFSFSIMESLKQSCIINVTLYRNTYFPEIIKPS